MLGLEEEGKVEEGKAEEEKAVEEAVEEKVEETQADPITEGEEEEVSLGFEVYSLSS